MEKGSRKATPKGDDKPKKSAYYTSLQKALKESLKNLTKKNELTRDELFEEFKKFSRQKYGIETTKESLKNYFSAKAIPRMDMLCAIADFFGVSVDYLIGRAKNISDENKVISQALALDDAAIENFKDVASHIRKYDAKDKHRTKIFNVKEGDEMLEAYNAFFSSPLLKSFLSEVSTFLSNFGYKYPVHYYYPDNNHDDETIPDCKIDDTIMDYSSNGTPLIHLAKEKDSPRYNASFQVNDRFVENLVLIEIQRVLVQMKNDRGDAK